VDVVGGSREARGVAADRTAEADLKQNLDRHAPRATGITASVSRRNAE
jgi:hypothetical protein